MTDLASSVHPQKLRGGLLSSGSAVMILSALDLGSCRAVARGREQAVCKVGSGEQGRDKRMKACSRIRQSDFKMRRCLFNCPTVCLSKHIVE